MPVRWTGPAANDLIRIVEAIRVNNPVAAQRIARTLYTGIAALRAMPNRNRTGYPRTGVFSIALYCGLSDY